MKYTVAEFRKNTREILNAVDQGADIYIQRYDTMYRISPSTFSPKPNEVFEGTAIGEPPRKVTLKARPQGKTAAAKKSVEQAQKRIDTKLGTMAEAGLAKLKKIPKDIAPVDSCPHGFAKGFCKKADCNRKYAK